MADALSPWKSSRRASISSAEPERIRTGSEERSSDSTGRASYSSSGFSPSATGRTGCAWLSIALILAISEASCASIRDSRAAGRWQATAAKIPAIASTKAGAFMALLFYDFNGNGDIDGLRRETHAIVAGLISELARKDGRAKRAVGGNFEIRQNLEIAAEDRERCFRKAVLFHLRLGV